MYYVPLAPPPLPQSSERPCCLALHCARVERAAVPRRAHVIPSSQCSVAYTVNWLGQNTSRERYSGMVVWFAGGPHWKGCMPQPWSAFTKLKYWENKLMTWFLDCSKVVFVSSLGEVTDPDPVPRAGSHLVNIRDPCVTTASGTYSVP